MRKYVLLFSFLALAALFALSACSSGSGSNDAPTAAATASPSPSDETSASPAAAEGQTIELTLTATNWKFDQDEIKAKAGDTLKLTFKSDEGMHSVDISDLGIELKNNETQEIKLDKAGTYEFHCNIMCGQGHDNMTGLIIVE